ncbi:Complement C1q-like protein 3, partial [Ophiophagus hannah]
MVCDPYGGTKAPSTAATPDRGLMQSDGRVKPGLGGPRGNQVRRGRWARRERKASPGARVYLGRPERLA